MAKVIPVGKARGTGRPDFSGSVEVATVPVIRSHQYRITMRGGLTNFPPDTYYFWAGRPTELIENKSVWFNSRASAGANVLIKLVFGVYKEAIDAIEERAVRYGYNEVTMTVPKGILINPLEPGEYLATGIANYGEVTTGLHFMNHGLLDVLAE